MSLLTSAYREQVKKSKHAENFVEAKTSFAFPTGIDLFDYVNGKYITTKDGNYYSLGLEQGSYIMLIGKSGTSKTTVALQMAGNIIRHYDESALFLDDIEAATDRSRIQNITKISDDEYEEKVIHRNTGITSENFYENITMIANKKMELAKQYPDEFLINTGKKDYKGIDIVIMPPTVYILDSLALLVPENISEEEQLSGLIWLD